ncbi:MAG: hypothetical protein AAGA25_17500 [Planctomycetota bacterium]
MSETLPNPSAEDTAAPPSFWRRLIRTPLRDIIRGRINGRLDLNAKLAAAGLSAEAETTVRDVVKGTRLWRLEKIEVADELIAHFQDGQQTEADSETTVLDFGQPAVTAKLIRRAKQRNRSIAAKAFVWTRRGIAVLLLFYILLAVRFFMGSPKVTVDYVAAMNADARAVPVEDHAWPVYREAWISFGMAEHELRPLFPENMHHSGTPLRAKDPGWGEARAFLAAHRPLLDALREAASKPGLGLEVGFDRDFTERERLALFGPNNQLQITDLDTLSPSQRLAEESVVGVLLPHLGLLRKSARLLSVDIDLAVEQGDSERVVANIESLLGMADHSTETNTLINGLVGLSILRLTSDKLEDVLIEAPDLLADQQLQHLQNQLNATSPRSMVRYDGERLFMYDTLQRMYTDDGQGNGRITAEGLRFFWSSLNDFPNQGVEDPGELWRTVESAAMPASLLLVASRREMRDKYDQLMDDFRMNGALPLRDVSAANDPDFEMMSWSVRERTKYLLISQLLPSLHAVAKTVERTEGRLEGVQLGLACERYRRDHAVWPNELEALNPEYLSTLPVDRITGNPLRYAVTDGHPLIYSVGVDRDDDHGRPPTNENDEPRPEYAASWNQDYYPDDEGDWVLFPTNTFRD